MAAGDNTVHQHDHESLNMNKTVATWAAETMATWLHFEEVLGPRVLHH